MILSEFDVLAAEAVADIALNESTLNAANFVNASKHLYYDEKKAVLHALLKSQELAVKVARSRLYVSYTQTHNRDLTEQGKEKYIDGETAFISAQERMLEVKEMYERYVAICNAFQARGYAINNLTKLAIAGITDVPY